jgi:hypothetical protein
MTCLYVHSFSREDYWQPGVYICIHITYTYINAYIYIYIYRHTFMHKHETTSIHTYIHTYIHAYIHTYIHTYTHTHIQVGLLPSEISQYIDSDSSKKRVNDSLLLLNQMLWNASRDGDIAAITRCAKFGADLNCVSQVCVCVCVCVFIYIYLYISIYIYIYELR